MKYFLWVISCATCGLIISGCSSTSTSITDLSFLPQPCKIVLQENHTQRSPYSGECKDGLAHGKGKVVIEKTAPKTGKKFLITYEGTFNNGYLTGTGKETEEHGLYWYEGTFNKWKRWSGTTYIAQTDRDVASTTYLWEGVATSSPIDITKDQFYYTDTNKTNTNSPTGHFSAFSGNGSTTNVSNNNGNSTRESGSFIGGLLSAPIRGIKGALKEREPEISQVWNNAPQIGVGLALQNYQERLAQRDSERKTAATNAAAQSAQITQSAQRPAQSPSNPAISATATPYNEIGALFQASFSNFPEKNIRVWFEWGTNSPPTTRTSARSIVGNGTIETGMGGLKPSIVYYLRAAAEYNGQTIYSPVVSFTTAGVAGAQYAIGQSAPVSPSSTPTYAAPIQTKPQATVQQAQSGGPVSPSLDSVSSATATNKQLTYADVLTPQEMALDDSLPHIFKATTQFSPAQIAEIKRDGRWGAWVIQNKNDVARANGSDRSSAQSSFGTNQNTPIVASTYQNGLTATEVIWKNSLPRDIRQRMDQFSPDMISRMKANGHWDIFVQGVNNDVAAQREAKREEAAAWGQFAFDVITLPVGELKVASLALTKGPVIVKEAIQTGKRIIEIATETKKGLITRRELDAVNGDGINKQKLPEQKHHYATNKNNKYTPAMEEIASKYGLKLDDIWNEELLPHQGRHPNAYHEFVLDGMRRAHVEAGGDKLLFLRLFDQYVKEPIRRNPELLRKSGWQ
ncbi:MAG: AHH domain-containing protein [Pseudomonadota bacterium]